MARDQVYRIHPLGICTREEEQALARRIRAGDAEARHELIERNIPLVIKLATIHVKQHHGLDLRDVIQDGTIGLMRAVEKFDPDRNIRFSTYASWWIRQALDRHAATLVHVPAHAWAKLAKEKRASAAGSPGEPAPATMKKRRLKFGPFVVQASRAMLPLDDDRTTPAEDHGARLDLADDLARLDAAMERIEPRQREVIRRRMGMDGHEPETLEAVGEAIGLTRERARQIQAEGMVVLARLMGQDEQSRSMEDAAWQDAERKRGVLNARERAIRARKRLAAGVTT